MAQTMAVKLRVVFIKCLIGLCRQSTIQQSVRTQRIRLTVTGGGDIVAYFAGRLAGHAGVCTLCDL